MSSVCALVGGQFGSEGKGLIAGHIANEYTAHVRVGAANAGHTLYTHYNPGYEDITSEGEYHKHVMQQIPCAAYANPHAELFIGPGALISPEIFMQELATLARWRVANGLDPMPSLWVDGRAHVITKQQINEEQKTGLAERIGSTSTIAKEGIGVAAADRLLRAERCMPAASEGGRAMLQLAAVEAGFSAEAFMSFDDVPLILARTKKILLEGTQGYGLSNTTGDFPYVTSRNTTAAGLAADSGVAPTRIDRVILVCRTFPIRVAGPSGPFAQGSEEITWDEVGIDPENERTTVTKKIRRVATFSMNQVAEAALVNGATEIALTFCDYLDPRVAGRTSPPDTGASKLWSLVRQIEGRTGLPVTFLGTGPHSVIEL